MRWVGLAAIVLVGLLYAHPLRSYLQAKHDLARRTADVQALKAEKRDAAAPAGRGEHGPGADRAGPEPRLRAARARSSTSSRASRPGSHEQGYDRQRWKDDRAIVERQLGRPPRAFRRVAVRCPFGRPAVTEQAPLDDAGEPFPTTYWITCPHLVAALARLEAAGGVERFGRLAARGPGARARASSAATRSSGALRPATLPAAPLTSDRRHAHPGGLKCLHAHAAFALARPGYELGERILAEVEPLWPERCCSAG